MIKFSFFCFLLCFFYFRSWSDYISSILSIIIIIIITINISAIVIISSSVVFIFIFCADFITTAFIPGLNIFSPGWQVPISYTMLSIIFSSVVCFFCLLFCNFYNYLYYIFY